MKNPLRVWLSVARAQRRGTTVITKIIKLSTKHVRTIGKPTKSKSSRKLGVTKSASTPKIVAKQLPGSFVDGHYSSSLGDLAYKLYTPPGPARAKRPLIVMLHGCGQTAKDFAVGSGMNQLADKHGLLVLYPQQSITANPYRCWNWHKPANRSRGEGEAALIAALTRQVAAGCKVNRDHVYIAGISAGGITAAVLGAIFPDQFAAVGVHSGLLAGNVTTIQGAMRAMRAAPSFKSAADSTLPLPTIIFHGDRDKVVDPANSAAFLQALHHAAHDLLAPRIEEGVSAGGRKFTRTQYLRMGKSPDLEVWIIHDGGHAWFGGNLAGANTDPAGPDASAAMVEFFLTHKRSKDQTTPLKMGR